MNDTETEVMDAYRSWWTNGFIANKGPKSAFIAGYNAALDAHRASQAHVITTVEELEALPDGTALRLARTDHHGQVLVTAGTLAMWFRVKSAIPESALPATVLTPTPTPSRP